jgi:hypothetical protein
MNHTQAIAASLEESREFDDVKSDREGFVGEGLVETFRSKLNNPVLPSAFALLLHTRAAKRRWKLVSQ